MVNAVLWVLSDGGFLGRDLPEHYPHCNSVYTRFCRCSEQGICTSVLRDLTTDADTRQRMDRFSSGPAHSPPWPDRSAAAGAVTLAFPVVTAPDASTEPASAGDRPMAYTWPTLKTRWAKRPSSIPRWLPARLHAWLHETSHIRCVEGLVVVEDPVRVERLAAGSDE